MLSRSHPGLFLKVLTVVTGDGQRPSCQDREAPSIGTVIVTGGH